MDSRCPRLARGHAASVAALGRAGGGRVDRNIDEALAYTRDQFGRRQVVSYARLISKGRQTLRRHPTIASCAKISAQEYVCIASQ